MGSSGYKNMGSEGTVPHIFLRTHLYYATSEGDAPLLLYCNESTDELCFIKLTSHAT